MRIQFKFFIVFVLFFIVFSFCCSSFGVYYDNIENYKTDPNYYIRTWQDNIASVVAKELNRGLYSDNLQLPSSFVNDILDYPIYIYPVESSNSYHITFNLIAYAMNSYNTLSEKAFNFYLGDGITCPSMVYTVQSKFSIKACYTINISNWSVLTVSQVTKPTEVLVAQCLYGYTPDCLIDFANNYTNKDNTNLEDINTSIEENNKLQQETNETLKDANDFLQQDIDKDNPSINLDYDTVDNPYDGDISSIFELFKNGFSSSRDLQFKLLNETITITPNYVEQNAPDALVAFLHTFWWFAVVIIIYKEVIHIFDKLSEGSIDKVNTDDPRVDLF